jgi:hypothetical protein
MVKIDGRSDLYSLGCTMYHLLSGQLPFKGESSMDCLVGRISGQAEPISEIMPGLPPRVVQTIEKLMATNPDDRYQSAGEAAAALRSLLRPKNAAPSPSVLAAAPIPAPTAPVPTASTTLEAPPPPVGAKTLVPKPKWDTLRARWTALGKKGKRLLAATVGVAAVLLIVAAGMLFRSSSDGQLTPQKDNPSTQAGPILPAGETDARQSGPVVQNPKQEAAVSKKADLASHNSGVVGADLGRAALVIESPKQGATVDMREDLTGRIESAGWPVIFVQADIPGQPWWCQAPVAKVEGGRFSANVVFGDQSTRSGTRFRIAAIVTPTREEALKFGIGSRQQALPEGFPQSVEVLVTHR